MACICTFFTRNHFWKLEFGEIFNKTDINSYLPAHVLQVSR